MDTDRTTVNPILEAGRNYYKTIVEPMIISDEFKKLIEEIVEISPRIKKDMNYDVFQNQHYIFAIEDGTDYNECLDILKTSIKSAGLMDVQNFFCLRAPATTNKNNVYSDAVNAILPIIKDKKCVLGIDITEWLSDLNNPELRRLLLFFQSYSGKAVFVFRIPCLDEENINKVYTFLSDVLTVRLVKFPPFTLDELVSYGKTKLEKYKFKADERVWELFRERIIQEKNEGKFYEKLTINKLVRELIYKKSCSDTLKGEEDYLITENDISGYVSTDIKNEESADEIMKNLIGLEDVKSQIKEMVQTITFIKNNKGFDRPCIHMRFVGNPGTGKTTFARIIGKMLKKTGVLSKGDFFEISARDLVGEYIGQTAPITHRICRDAYGSVLFIDEAYSLYVKISENDYGKEAIAALISEMENHRDDFVVIMAGYEEEMETLMTSNPGLPSRMPYILTFPNYTREEMAKIYFSLIPDSVTYSDDFKKCVEDFFNDIPDSVLDKKEFSNARFVRNLYELTFTKAIIRMDSPSDEKLSLQPCDFELACSSKSIEQLMEGSRKVKIGFMG